jgi:DNA-binding GntR family transcriptional regulator
MTSKPGQRVGKEQGTPHGRFRDSPKTKTTFVVESLRKALANQDIAPGERFDVRKLAAELNVSITPVREALRMLQAEGLVQYDEHKAISAINLTPEDATEIYALRCLLEAYSAELAATRLKPFHREQILLAHEEMAAAVADGRSNTHEANANWHFAVYRAAESRFTVTFIETLWSAFDWASIWTLPGRLERSLEEHEAITAAVVRGDREAAGTLMRSHILGGEEAVLEFHHIRQSEAVGTSSPRRQRKPVTEQSLAVTPSSKRIS